MAQMQASKLVGKVLQVIGPVVDVEFTPGGLSASPEIEGLVNVSAL